MKAEGRKQRAESREQKVESSGSFYCLLPTAYCLLSFVASPPARALLVAALLISAYALLRYWRSLNGRSNVVRFSLVTLRAVTLLLMSCALAGLEVEYETGTRARVLLSNARVMSSKAESGATGVGFEDKSEAQMVAALKKKGLEVAALEDESEEGKDDNVGFVASTLFADGAMRAEDARREVERISARAGGAPVYVIADLNREETASVALDDVTALGSAKLGVPVMVRCDVHARRLKGHESLVTISDDAKVQTSARIVWTDDDERQSVTLSVIPKVAGWIDYSAKVEAAGNEDSSKLTRQFSLYSEERRSRVLFFDSEPTWEAKFIRRALEQTGLFDVDYFAQVSRAATTGISEEAKEQGAGAAQKEEKSAAAGNAPEAKLHATLQNTARLDAYDCVIVGATDNSLLSSAEVAHLSDWVERRGGGLVTLGGNGFNGSIVSPSGKLYSLLPAEISTPQFQTQSQMVSQGHPLEAEKTRETFALTPTLAGASGALEGYLNASEDKGEKAAALAEQGLRLSALRPGASVLAVAGQLGASGTSEAGTPLVAAMRYGAGRTLLFGPADSWRIRTTSANDEAGAGDSFNALWQGVVLWTSACARPAVEITLSDESPEEGDSVTAEIRVRDASFSPLKIEKLNARLQPLTEDKSEASTTEAEEVAFAPDTSDLSIWRARFPLHARGRFALDVDYIAGGKSANVLKYFTVVAPVPNEAGAAFDTLRRVARETGGDLVTPAEINDLAQRLASTSSSRETIRRTWQLRTWLPLAFIIPLLLSTEWFARRWWKAD
ncbi:MAG: hypothetical protein DMF68_11135 [Acidobacteria bacterium]|nr:MAG: hypothetical protein DMF68_11135 [Acidobacteriota bacterium]